MVGQSSSRTPRMFVSQLTACSGNIASPAGAQMGVDAMLPKHLLKRQHVLSGRPIKWETFDLVVANEIDICPQPACELGQLPRMLRAIVDPAQEQILQSDFATGFLKILIAR